jgi:glycosyltransferase involved in cell wall biosynthesis
MPNISAFILARNEEKNLRYCLETLRWCDEIVVVDMESEDGTASVAREYTDKVYFHERILSFDIAKKFGVERTTGDWVLLVDADEMIQGPLADKLVSLSRDPSIDIVEIPFKHFIMGEWVEHTGWGYTPLPRFFRKGKIRFTGTIHGYMHKDPSARTVTLESLDEYCVYHFAYVDSEHFVRKLNLYTTVESNHLFQDNAPFSRRRMVSRALREFVDRYVGGKGYRDGIRGFSLAVMMAFYRALTYIKLWERYEFRGEPAATKYERIRTRILAGKKTAGADPPVRQETR